MKLQVAEVKNRLPAIQRNGKSDPESALKAIDALVDKLKPKGEALQEVLYAKAIVLFRNDKDESKKTFAAALRLAPDSKLGRRIERVDD